MTYVETHSDIVANRVFSPADLTPKIPAGLKMEAPPVPK